MRPRLAVLAASVVLAGCALKPEPSPDDVLSRALPTRTQRIPSAWTAQPALGGDVANGWLKDFDDPVLTRIVSEAIANNLDLRQAASRVDVAQQQVVLAGSQMQPQIGASLGGRATNDSASSSTFTSSQIYANVAWELDVWGRLRAQTAAAQAGFEASALDYAFARQSLAALTGKAWTSAVESRQLLALAEQSVATYEQLLALVNVRRQAGRVGDLDVAESAAKVLGAKASLEGARQAFAAARRALEVLLGRYPAGEIEVAAAFTPLPPQMDAGLPAALLQRRPDLLGAERDVVAAFRAQEAAELALLPSFGIGLAGGRLGDGLLALLQLNPWLATAAIGMSIPIYTGGALEAQVAIATAQQAGAVAHYGGVALTAFREVEDALSAEHFLALRLPYQTGSEQQRVDAVRIATIQYRAGRIDLLWVSMLQTEQIASAEEVIKLRAAQRVNRIKLDLALGRSFDAAAAAPVVGLQQR